LVTAHGSEIYLKHIVSETPPEAGNRIHFPKCSVLSKNRTMDNVQNCDNYEKGAGVDGA
jgi:hypothetical protein